MKINPTDVYNSSTLAFNQLKVMYNEAQRFQNKAERILKTNHLLIHYIQQGRITETNDIDCAQAWLDHSTLEPEEIISKIFGED